MPNKIKWNAKYDWEKAERIYMHGEITKLGLVKFYNLREIADKLNIPHIRMRQQASKLGWSQKRKQIRIGIEQKILELNAERVAGLADKLDNKILDISMRAIETIRAYFILQEKRVKKAIREGDDKFELLSPDTLFKIGSALQKFQSAGKVSIGEVMPPVEKENPFNTEFEEKESEMTPEQRKQFVKLAIQFRKQSLETKSNGGNGNGNGNK